MKLTKAQLDVIKTAGDSIYKTHHLSGRSQYTLPNGMTVKITPGCFTALIKKGVIKLVSRDPLHSQYKLSKEALQFLSDLKKEDQETPRPTKRK